ncbi:MAG: ribosome recycling factor, partial [Pseudonocardiaceae bacterium]
AKISIRNIRRRAKEELDRIQRDGEAGEDEVRRAEKELDDLTTGNVHHIDELMKHKESELLEV